MKAADISDADFCRAVETMEALRGVATRWDVADVLAGAPVSLGGQVYDWPNMPPKVVLAKAQRLIKRGLVTGCTCGCRGAFELVDQH